MKTIFKPYFFLLTGLLIFFNISAGEFCDKGVISGWEFAPVQLDASLINSKILVDENSDTAFSFGLFLLQQKSAVFSIAFIANTLQKNYGLQINPLFMGVMTEKNFGISIGFENFCKKCYGIQIGVLNHSWSGEQIEESRKRLQVFGINIADTVYLGLVNISNRIQIGLLNLSPGAVFQIGLLNHNLKSYIPWMPLINWNMGREIPQTAEK